MCSVANTACQSCGAPIVFARTTTGKPAPFEADRNGLWTIENGAARYLGTATTQLDLGAEQVERFTSHFASCPQAKGWRK